MNERILSYSLSRKITEEELGDVTGGSFAGTGQAPETWDFHFDIG